MASLPQQSDQFQTPLYRANWTAIVYFGWSDEICEVRLKKRKREEERGRGGRRKRVMAASPD
tara:strand:- start:648 stop:833 length:186 start_codon:yes stop_codon:yes gene_type:complete